MSDNCENTTSSGKITSGISHNSLTIQTVDFVYNNLAPWRDDPHRQNESAEDKLNLQLCKHLDSKARNDFPMVRFNHEEYQTERRRIDISASPAKSVVIGVKLYTIYDPFLVLECKRLPAPSKDREKEYVSGGRNEKSGGIQRFKLGLHGEILDIAVIIGYIQDNSSNFWQNKINEWILEFSKDHNADCCIWSENEILRVFEEDLEKAISRYRSEHNRILNHNNTKNIELHHLWVLMKANAK
jgi:hypothetical protein